MELQANIAPRTEGNIVGDRYVSQDVEKGTENFKKLYGRFFEWNRNREAKRVCSGVKRWMREEVGKRLVTVEGRKRIFYEEAGFMELQKSFGEAILKVAGENGVEMGELGEVLKGCLEGQAEGKEAWVGYYRWVIGRVFGGEVGWALGKGRVDLSLEERVIEKLVRNQVVVGLFLLLMDEGEGGVGFWREVSEGMDVETKRGVLEYLVRGILVRKGEEMLYRKKDEFLWEGRVYSTYGLRAGVYFGRPFGVYLMGEVGEEGMVMGVLERMVEEGREGGVDVWVVWGYCLMVGMMGFLMLCWVKVIWG